MIIEKLIRSDDPDDRDTASEILQEINTPRSYELMRLLLKDDYPYLQLDACDFLIEKYPVEVEKTLQKLSNHENENVREAANKRLQKINDSKQ